MNFSGILGGVTALGMAFVSWAVIPERPFLTVHEMQYLDGAVVAERTIRGPRRIADWRVTILNDNDDSPICQTVPGRDLHQGWSDYEPSARGKRSFPLDVWVGDPGCFERLASGQHAMFVTWTPRDGTPTVTAKTTFQVN